MSPAVSASATAVPAGTTMVAGRTVNGMVIPAPGYIPKAGELTAEEIEAELALLMERMVF